MITISEWETEIGVAIRQLRLESELGQQGLADRANISRSAVQGLENGRGTQLKSFLAVLRALGRTDTFDSILPPTGLSPIEALKESRRKAALPQRHREGGK